MMVRRCASTEIVRVKRIIFALSNDSSVYGGVRVGALDVIMG